MGYDGRTAFERLFGKPSRGGGCEFGEQVRATACARTTWARALTCAGGGRLAWAPLGHSLAHCGGERPRSSRGEGGCAPALWRALVTRGVPVSYTHLTLPTICSV
eukprot:15340320-Alexandrium_andersonii.AAC.1